MTEQTDAIVVVVSEESGQISLVERARIVRNLDEPKLARSLAALLHPADRREPLPAGAGRRPGGSGRRFAQLARRARFGAMSSAAGPPRPRDEIVTASSRRWPGRGEGFVVRVLRFIVRNWPLKIGAVLLAIILYVGMVALQTTQEWPGTIAIELVNQPANAVPDEAQIIPPEVGNIRYIAAPDVPVTRDSFRATADLANAKVSESEDSLVKVDLARTGPAGSRSSTISRSRSPWRSIRSSTSRSPSRCDTSAVPSGLQPGTPVLEPVDGRRLRRGIRSSGRVAYADAQRPHRRLRPRREPGCRSRGSRRLGRRSGQRHTSTHGPSTSQSRSAASCVPRPCRSIRLSAALRRRATTSRR